MKASKIGRFFQYAALSAAGIIMVFPFVWMVLSSLKVPTEIAARPLVWFPAVPQWSNYLEAWKILDFGTLFLNSVLVTTITSGGVMLISSMLGYALAKLPFPGSQAVFYLILALMMIPFFMMMVPMYVIVHRLGWINSFAGVIVPEIAPAFGIFLMRQFMLGVPDDLLDAARIDGAGEFRVFWQVAMPLSKSGLSALAIFAFIYHWDNFLWPSLILIDATKQTIPVGLNRFWDPNLFGYYNIFLAGSVLAILPMLIFFLFAQRRFIEGIAVTGLKG
jgi:multiple sugar transport system permease protein